MKIRIKRKQQGSILILNTFILIAMTATALHFFGQTLDSTKMAGATRDSAESLLLAESAMELMRGRFINDLDTVAAVNVAGCDVGGKALDKCEASVIRNNIATPQNYLMPYMYYVSDSGAIEQTSASLLQKVADGEGGYTASAGALASQQLPTATTTLRVDDLFGAGFSPRLFTINNKGLIDDSAAANWSGETSTHKAAAWFEVVLNPDDNTAVDLYVQAVAQVGNGKSYLQRYVGSYFSDDTLGTLVSPLAESSNINREP